MIEKTVLDLVGTYNSNHIVVNDQLINVIPYWRYAYTQVYLAKNPFITSILEGTFKKNIVRCAKTESGINPYDGGFMLYSIINYIRGKYSIKGRNIENLSDEQLYLIGHTKIYFEITEMSKLELYSAIRQYDKKYSTRQELLNIMFPGYWLIHLQDTFCSPISPYYELISDYIQGTMARQVTLHNVLSWIDTDVNGFMSRHYQEPDALKVINQFLTVINWIKGVFPQYHPAMKGINWGRLYSLYGKNEYDPDDNVKEMNRLLADEGVEKPSNIFEYILGNKQNYQILKPRLFSKTTIFRKAVEQKYKCPLCGKPLNPRDFIGDHIIPYIKGGTTTYDNCQVVHRTCNLVKGIK